MLKTDCLLGKGAYGAVYGGEFTVGGSALRVAVKSFCRRNTKAANKTEDDESDFLSIANELLGTDGSDRFCRALIPRVGVLRAVGGSWLDWHVVMDRATTDLQCSAMSTPMPLRVVATWGAQIASGLAYLHSRGIVHRDLKASNVLLVPADGEWRVCLADWGMVMLRETSFDTHVTTAWYRAPEIVLGMPHTSAADVWSFGVLLRRLAVGREFVSCEDSAPILLDQVFQRLPMPSEQDWPDMHAPQLKLAPHVASLRAREIKLGLEATRDLMAGPYKPPAKVEPLYSLLHGSQRGAVSSYAGGNRPMGQALSVWTARMYGSCNSGRPAFSPQLSTVLQACLQPNPARRPSMAEVLAMPFFVGSDRALSSSDQAFVAQRAAQAEEEFSRRPRSPTTLRESPIGPQGHLLPCPTLSGHVPSHFSLPSAAPLPLAVQPCAPAAAVRALFGGESEAMARRGQWIADLCCLRASLELPASCIFYAVDFVDRVAGDLVPSQLRQATVAALFCAQAVRVDYHYTVSMAALMKAVGVPPSALEETRECCCRLLASLQFSIHGGGDEDPAVWSVHKALLAAAPNPTPRQVSAVMVGLCLWPLHGADEGLDRLGVVAGCLGHFSGQDSASTGSAPCRLMMCMLEAATNAESFRAVLEGMVDGSPSVGAANVAPLIDSVSACSSIHSVQSTFMEE